MSNSDSLERIEDVLRQATCKQREVLDLLADGRTSKEIALHLGISPSAVNHRIEPLRQKAGGQSRLELARRWRSLRDQDCKPITGDPIPVSEGPHFASDVDRTPGPGVFRFNDAGTFDGDVIWPERRWEGGSRWLDGPHALWFRSAAIFLLLIGLLAGLVLSLMAADVVTNTLAKAGLI